MIEKVLVDQKIEITDDKESRKAELIRLCKLKY